MVKLKLVHRAYLSLYIKTIFSLQFIFPTIIGIYGPTWMGSFIHEATPTLDISMVDTINEKILSKLDGLLTFNVSPMVSDAVYHFNLTHSHQVHLYAMELEPPHIDTNPYNPAYYNVHSLLFVLDGDLPYFNNKFIKINYPIFPHHYNNPMTYIKNV